MNKLIFNTTLGTEIWSIRMSRGLSQEAMMAKGFTAQQLSRWETGKLAPNAFNLLRLSRVLDCKIDEFYRGFHDAR